ncbi:hypothetical protein D8Y22_02295 [Salinadaptatus halalkaliphilus]|uniref:Uncharacterized protein n=1 Tax=Salinadaptatus halalkaliphilus TaxID=2419781 RepID=A0A4S3TPY0_9EURY|nr:hypothetical protein [Salinadaptatus halalkaliphilus]THE66412.1 hypothetical protein D8Y22_02295 [Salinadaptatus halalkaliphilus]
MPVDRLLPEFLQREPESDTDDAVLHECRHCGSKFEEPVDQCPVCDATEIATYKFPAADEAETDDESTTDSTTDTATDPDTD